MVFGNDDEGAGGRAAVRRRWLSRPVRGQGNAIAASRDVAVVIPARNEEARIDRCLEALALQGPAALARTFIVLVANNCTDMTVGRAVDAARRLGLALHALDLVFPDGGSVGLARQVGCRTALTLQPGLGYILTSDADGRVAPDWVANSVRHLETVDAVCGRFHADPAEEALLPDHIRPAAALEYIYFQASLEFESLLRTHSSTSRPHHGQAGGASLGFRVDAFEALGGFRDMICGEDREIIRRFKDRGYRVRHADDVRVVVSCRLDGRAPGGMADSISRRIADNDDWADESLLPARLFVRKGLGAAESQRAFHLGDPAEPAHRLRPSGLSREIDALTSVNARLRMARPGDLVRTLRDILASDMAADGDPPV
ncbi:glycosyltransferase family 2 protein [Microbaculum marinum]|uniref:Glycosyltransferase family 2 protein n=1 Tax=Microbaculum marinum TaxID=1764581 RepID=A0AAW9RZJ2_9HYPH